MAERRMFAKTIIDSDAFLDMPPTTQNLYFHLSMRADDDGFINKPKSIMRLCGSREDDMKLLIVKKFILPFDTGVVVIKHWKIHNYIQRDRYKPTVYQLEKEQLVEKSNKSYTLAKPIDNQCIQNVSKVETQDRLGKDRVSIELGKDSIDTTYLSVQKTDPPLNFEQIMSYWNQHSNLKSITAITDKRKNHLIARIKSFGIEAIYKAIDNVGASQFLQGGNNKGWIATFDWVFLPNNFIKVLEGNYSNSKQTSQKRSSDMTVEERVARADQFMREFGKEEEKTELQIIYEIFDKE